MDTCEAILELADDYGDNICTVHCQLEGGHSGPHVEEFKRQDKPVVITFECDEREPCTDEILE